MEDFAFVSVFLFYLPCFPAGSYGSSSSFSFRFKPAVGVHYCLVNELALLLANTCRLEFIAENSAPSII